MYQRGDRDVYHRGDLTPGYWLEECIRERDRDVSAIGKWYIQEKISFEKKIKILKIIIK